MKFEFKKINTYSAGQKKFLQKKTRQMNKLNYPFTPMECKIGMIEASIMDLCSFNRQED